MTYPRTILSYLFEPVLTATSLQQTVFWADSPYIDYE